MVLHQCLPISPWITSSYHPGPARCPVSPQGVPRALMMDKPGCWSHLRIAILSLWLLDLLWGLFTFFIIVCTLFIPHSYDIGTDPSSAIPIFHYPPCPPSYWNSNWLSLTACKSAMNKTRFQSIFHVQGFICFPFEPWIIVSFKRKYIQK